MKIKGKSMTTETYQQWLTRVQAMIIQKRTRTYFSATVDLEDFNEFVKERDFIPVKERDEIESIYLESLDEVTDIGRTLAKRVQRQVMPRPIDPRTYLQR
jgi:hypothetical protein